MACGLPLHTVGKCFLARKDVRPLDIRAYHGVYCISIRQFTDNDRYFIKSGKPCRIFPPVTGYDFITAMLHRSCDNRDKHPLFPNAVHKLLHILVINDSVWMVSKVMQFVQGYLHRMFVTVTDSEKIVIGVQLILCLFNHHQAPSLSDSHMPLPRSPSDRGYKCSRPPHSLLRHGRRTE